MTKNCVIIGSYGFGNIGDEAILDGILSDFRRHLNDTDFLVVTGNPKEIEKRHRTKTIYWKDIPAILNALDETDLIILGGGGLFYDYWGFNPSAILTVNHSELSYYVGFPILATLINKPLMIYGVGVAELLSEDSRLYTRAAFELATLATVRDNRSKEILISLGLDEERIRVTADPAWSLGKEHKVPSKSGFREILPAVFELEEPIVGVALRNWDIGVDQDHWEAEVASALDRFLDAYGGSVLFFPFQSVEGILTDDKAVAKSVKNRMLNGARALVSTMDYAPSDVIGHISNIDLLIGMRMHSILFAAMVGVPFVGLSYDPKVEGLINHLGCSDYSIELSSVNRDLLFELSKSAFKRRDAFREQLSMSVKELTDLAKTNAMYAANLIDQAGEVTEQPAEFAESMLKDMQIRHVKRIFELQTAYQKTTDRLEESIGAFQDVKEELTEIREKYISVVDDLRDLRADHETLKQSFSIEEDRKNELKLAVEKTKTTIAELRFTLEHFRTLADDRLEELQKYVHQENMLRTHLQKEREAHGKALDMLDEISSSRAWRLTRLLWRVRISLAPHGTRREKILQKLLRALGSSRENNTQSAGSPFRQTLASFYEAAAQSDTLRRTSRIIPSSVKSSMRSAYQETNRLPPESLGDALAQSQSELSRLPTSAPIREVGEGQGSGSSIAILTNQLLDWKTREPRYGGGERYCITIGELLQDLGFQVTFYQAGHDAFEAEYYGFRVNSLELDRSYSEFQYGVCDKFYKLTRDYDHIILNLPEYASGRVREDALLICHGIWFDHENYGPPISFRSSEWFRHLFRAFSQPKRVVSNDTNSINVIRAFWPNLAKKMFYIPNWVDTQEFQPNFDRGEEGHVVLFPRRSQINRGSRILADILANIPYDWRFLWVGKGDAPDNQITEQIARKDPRLDFLSATFEQMPGYYHRAEICVIPTIACEGTSLACLEAMASGCAIVATHVGGLSNLIFPNVNGLMVEPTAQSVADAVNFLIENPEERARLQVAAVQSAKSFGLEIWKKRWHGLLRELDWIPISPLETNLNG